MEILFDNPFIIIILIAALSSMFKNKKKAAEEGHRKRGTSHTPASKRERPSNRMDEMKEIFKEVTRTLTEEHPASAKKVEEMYQEKNIDQLKEAREQKSVVKGDMKGIATGISQEPDRQTMKAEKKDNGMNIDESTLVDAVVWSEILGPPRAKNPYRNRRT